MRKLLAVAFVLSACSNATLPNEDDKPSEKHNANTATADEWKGQVAGTTEELFAGRFPGVEVKRIGGGIAVRIRGAASGSGDTEPLYVIDGMTIEAGPGGALMGINPQDIEKIEILKDIGSTAFYGVRGANGVILIKTKRGK
jgi:TonB-dependent starch-binding outer membrane protein SusC